MFIFPPFELRSTNNSPDFPTLRRAHVKCRKRKKSIVSRGELSVNRVNEKWHNGKSVLGSLSAQSLGLSLFVNTLRRNTNLDQ